MHFSIAATYLLGIASLAAAAPTPDVQVVDQPVAREPLRSNGYEQCYTGAYAKHRRDVWTSDEVLELIKRCG